MQYLIRETTYAKNSIKHALETTYQPIPDTTLMWCAGWIEPPLYTFVRSSAAMLTTFNFSILSGSSFSAPIKLVPLSDRIMEGVPLRDTNGSTPITQELVSMDVTISTWTERVVRQVKRKPHIFSVVRRTVT